jgi:hypothetical protein
MAITSENGLIAALASGQLFSSYYQSIGSTVGRSTSLWTAGGQPGAGAIPVANPTGGVVPTSATAGAIPLVNPSGANTLYLARLTASSSVANFLRIYDRLVHTSTLNASFTSAQTVNTVAITRTYSTPVSAWVEVYSPLGSTTTGATVSYTNQAGTTGRAGTVQIAASAANGNLFPIALQSGDTGVQSVQSITLSVSTGTAGNFGITLMANLASVGIPGPGLALPPLNYAALALPVIQPNACLAALTVATTSSTGNIWAEMTLAQG